MIHVLNDVKYCPICRAYVPASPVKSEGWMDGKGHYFTDEDGEQVEQDSISEWIPE